jgi:rhodanese-related sulfurtransferase
MVNDNFNISVYELKQRLDAGEDILLLDIREPFESQICVLPNSVLMPMGEIPLHVADLDPQRETVVYCHAGVRSVRVVAWLQRQGFANIRNLLGGIDAWSCHIDPNVPRY